MTEEQLSLLLRYLGYPGAEALRAFQRAYGGLDIDGIPGPKTWAALKAAVARDWHKPGEDFWAEIRYFTREEFRCHCGGKHCDGFPAEPEEKLIRLADRVRTHFGVPVTVSSGVRCPVHNKAVGGVSNSRHLSGKAMDFSVRGFSSSAVVPYVQSLTGVRYAYAIDHSFVHMDIE